MKCKAFDLFIRSLNSDPQKMKMAFKDNRLTVAEKKIVEGYLAVRDNKSLETIPLILSIPPSEHEFVNAHKHHLLGICYNLTTDFKSAVQHLNMARDLFDDLKLDYYQFMARFNLFMVYSNIGNHEMTDSVLKEMELYHKGHDLKTIRFLRCKFIRAEELLLKEEGLKLIDELDKFKNVMSENDRINQLVCEYSFYTKVDEFQKAEECLAQMKQFRKYALSDNYNYMKKLLLFYSHNAPIYLKSDDFQESPRLKYQVLLIQALESQEIDIALKYWAELAKIEPGNYDVDFNYKGPKSIFSLCLDKFKDHSATKIHSPVTSNSSKAELLIEILQSARAPISKERLYQILWSQSPESKDDLMRLTRLIYSIKDKVDFEIQTRKGTYQVIHPQEKKKKIS